MAAKKTFEENMARLEAIVTMLEKGDATLGDSMALFEEGAGLLRECTARIDAAEQQVRLLVAGENGTPEEKAFPEQEG